MSNNWRGGKQRQSRFQPSRNFSQGSQRGGNGNDRAQNSNFHHSRSDSFHSESSHSMGNPDRGFNTRMDGQQQQRLMNAPPNLFGGDFDQINRQRGAMSDQQLASQQSILGGLAQSLMGQAPQQPQGIMGQGQNQSNFTQTRGMGGQFGNQISLGMSDNQGGRLTGPQMLMNSPPPILIAQGTGSMNLSSPITTLMGGGQGFGNNQSNLSGLQSLPINQNSNQYSLLSGTNLNLSSGLSSGIGQPQGLSAFALQQQQNLPQVGLSIQQQQQLVTQLPQQAMGAQQFQQQQFGGQAGAQQQQLFDQQQQLHQHNMQHMKNIQQGAVGLLPQDAAGLLRDVLSTQSLISDRREVVIGRDGGFHQNEPQPLMQLGAPGNAMQHRLGNRGPAQKHGWSEEVRPFDNRNQRPGGSFDTSMSSGDGRSMSPPNKTRRMMGGGMAPQGFQGNRDPAPAGHGPQSLLGLHLDSFVQKNNSKTCVVCNRILLNDNDHYNTTDHKKKAQLINKGCLLCKSGKFRTYPDYVAHISSDMHKQNKDTLNKKTAGSGTGMTWKPAPRANSSTGGPGQNPSPKTSSAGFAKKGEAGISPAASKTTGVIANKTGVSATGGKVVSGNNKPGSTTSKPAATNTPTAVKKTGLAVPASKPGTPASASKPGTPSTKAGTPVSASKPVTGSKTVSPAIGSKPGTPTTASKQGTPATASKPGVNNKSGTVIKTVSATKCTAPAPASTAKTTKVVGAVDVLKTGAGTGKVIAGPTKKDDELGASNSFTNGDTKGADAVEFKEPLEAEPCAETLKYEPTKHYGREHVIKVTGYFCKICHKFYNNESMATDTHCKMESHFEKYRAALLVKQRASSIKGEKSCTIISEMKSNLIESPGKNHQVAEAVQMSPERQSVALFSEILSSPEKAVNVAKASNELEATSYDSTVLSSDDHITEDDCRRSINYRRHGALNFAIKTAAANRD